MSNRAKAADRGATAPAARESFAAADDARLARDPAQRENGEALASIPLGWRDALRAELSQPYFSELMRFVTAERIAGDVYPAIDAVYTALRLTAFDDVSVLILGQDPYHGAGQAHGLCFSVNEGVAPPPSLVNIMKELQSDLGLPRATTGCLTSWARQGVLLLNAVLTVRAGAANSHRNQGWERFTDAIIRALSERKNGIVFVLWGGYAGKKERLIDTARHHIIKSAHPSPLSAYNGFFGSRPFSRINAALRAAGRREIDWRID